MYRIVLISRFSHETVQLKNLLMFYPEYQIEWVRTPQQATLTLSQNPPDMIIFNVDHFSQQKEMMAYQLRKMGFKFPILFLSNSGARLFQKSARRLGNTGIIEKPCDEHELIGVIQKLRNGKRVSHRVYRRYAANQRAGIEFWNTGHKINGVIEDLSLGGARLKVKDTHLSVGDVLKLNVELEKIAKRHALNAKVVWAGEYDPITKTNQVGIQFVKTVEIYQNLLSRI